MHTSKGYEGLRGLQDKLTLNKINKSLSDLHEHAETITMISAKEIKELKREFKEMSENVFVRVLKVGYGIRIAKIRKDGVQALNSGEWIPFSNILSYYTA